MKKLILDLNKPNSFKANLGGRAVDVWVCGSSLESSNPAKGMVVCLSSVLCVVRFRYRYRYRSLRRICYSTEESCRVWYV